jgi:hypothetical protein
MKCIAYNSGYKYQLKETYTVAIAIKPSSPIDTEYLDLDIEPKLTGCTLRLVDSCDPMIDKGLTGQRRLKPITNPCEEEVATNGRTYSTMRQMYCSPM